MQNYTIAFLAAVSLVSFGCKKKGDGGEADKKVVDDKPAPAGDKPAGDTPAPAKPDDKPAAAGGCVPNTDGGFCLAVPAAMKAGAAFKKSDTERAFDYSDGSGKSLKVVVTTMSDPAAEWDSEVSVRTDEGKKKTNVQASDLPDGGKFFSWVDGDTNWVTTLTHKDKLLFFCRTSGKPAADPAMVDACKSMKPL